jgi:hypothetical protein
MSTEYEDVLTNQPVVIDNVRIGPPIHHFVLTCFSLFFLLGLGNNQSWIRRPGSSKMFFPLIVRAARRSLFSGRVCGGGGLTLFFPIPIPM